MMQKCNNKFFWTSLKTRFFEAGKFLTTGFSRPKGGTLKKFTFVNEDFKNEAQQKKSSF